MEWVSNHQLQHITGGTLCCGQPCVGCTYPRAFSTKRIGMTDSSLNRGVQFRCDAACLVGISDDNKASPEKNYLDYSIQVANVAAEGSCSVKVIENGLEINISHGHQSGLLSWPLQHCNSETVFGIWLHRNGKIQYSINGIVFYQSETAASVSMVGSSSYLLLESLKKLTPICIWPGFGS